MPPETDPSEFENKPVLTDPQNWASRSHQELYAAVHNNNDPGQAGQISSEWSKYGSELTEAARTINAVITASESKWTGGAAEAARDAMKKLGDWVDETARTAVEVGNKVSEQGRVMETARAQMPAPVEFDWNKVATLLAGPGTPAFVVAAVDIAITNVRSRAAHDQAISVMTSMEANSREIDTSTPTFKPPFNPVTGKVEEPVVAVRRMAPVNALGGADALMSTRPQDGAATAAPPSPATGAAPGGAPLGGVAGVPAAAGYTPPTPGYTPPADPGGGAGGYTPQMPNYNPGNTTAAAATYTPPAPSYTPPPSAGTTYTSGGGGNNYTPQFPVTGTPHPGAGPVGGPGSTPRPNASIPKPTTPPGLNNPNTYLPKDTNLPKGMTPGVTGGGGGAGGGGGGGGGGGAGAAAAAAAAAMKGGAGGFGGGGAFGGAGAAGGAGGGGPMQSGGAAGVAQGGRAAMPTGMTLPGASAATGGAMGAAPMGAGAGAAGGRGSEDKERKSASYIMGGDLFEVPGENLPPSVIGGTKPKKQKGPEQS